MVASFDRAWPNAAAQEKRLRTAQAAFVKTPSDAALVNRVAEYQRRVQKEAENPHGPIAAVIQGGLAAAHRAANAYAREKGFNAPYPNE